jgi:hypothetical protein
MVQDALHDLAAAVDQVDHSGRQLERVEHLERDLLGQRHLLGGLEHEGVAAGDRERQEPERHHGREVEGHDGRADAYGLTHRLGIHVARDVLEDAPLHRRRHGAGGLDHLDHSRHLGARVGDRLAHLRGHRARQLLPAVVQPGAQREEAPPPLDHAHRTPCRQRIMGSPHSFVQVGA